MCLAELTNNFMTLGKLYPCICCIAALIRLGIVQVQRYRHLSHNKAQYGAAYTSKKEKIKWHM